jgi:activator of 2-hydroxyglutaryl-CoA dehydratase
MVVTLEKRLGLGVNVGDDSHYMGALGAALFALDRIRAGREPAQAPGSAA